MVGNACTQGIALVEVDPALGKKLNAFVLQGAGQAAERMGMGIRHIIAVGFIDADADPVDACADGQPGQRKAKSLASIANCRPVTSCKSIRRF